MSMVSSDITRCDRNKVFNNRHIVRTTFLFGLILGVLGLLGIGYMYFCTENAGSYDASMWLLFIGGMPTTLFYHLVPYKVATEFNWIEPCTVGFLFLGNCAVIGFIIGHIIRILQKNKSEEKLPIK